MTQPLLPPEQASLAVLTRFDHLVRSSRIYPDGHNANLHAIHGIGELFENLTHGEDRAQVFISGDRVIFRGRRLRPSAAVRAGLRELGVFLRQRGLGGIDVSHHARDEGVQKFVRVLLQFPGDSGPGPDIVNRELDAAGVRHIRVTGFADEADVVDVQYEGDAALRTARLYLRSLRCAHALRHQPMSPSLRLELVRCGQGITELVLDAPTRALALVRPKELTPWSLAHPVHTAIYSVLIGQGLGLHLGELEQLAQCALVLSIGLPEDSTEDEDPRGRPPRLGDIAAATAPPGKEDTLNHSRIIRHLLGDGALDPLSRRILRTAFEHDLGADLQGPPDVLRWPTLHPFTHILAAAATFDKLRDGRASGRPLLPVAALEQMRLERGRFHDDVLMAISALLPDLEVVGAYL